MILTLPKVTCFKYLAETTGPGCVANYSFRTVFLSCPQKIGKSIKFISHDSFRAQGSDQDPLVSLFENS